MGLGLCRGGSNVKDCRMSEPIRFTIPMVAKKIEAPKRLINGEREAKPVSTNGQTNGSRQPTLS